MPKPQQIPLFAQALDPLIRQGRIAEARAGLKAQLTDRREDAPWLAWIARRTGQPELSLRLLHRWVRPPERKRAQVPTGHEVLEYGGALANLFATREARDLLSGLDPREFPEALFFQALASISEWDHASAIDWLERFLAQPSVEPYRRLVGQVNLALSQVLGQRFEEARTQLDANIEACRKHGAQLLLANSLETLAHLEYLAGDLPRADAAVAQAQELLRAPEFPLRDAFFIEKWRVLIAHRRDPSRKTLRIAEGLQRQARERREFETVRAMDFHLGRDLKDSRRLARVYFGSPFAMYQERIARTAASLGVELPASYAWKPDGGAMKPSLIRTAREISQVAPKPGLLQGLLRTLSSDHYRPFPLLALHERLYPGSHFNPRSSRDQIHQLMLRLRHGFREQGLALEVQERRGAYCLEGTQPLLLRREDSVLKAWAREAGAAMGAEAFSSSEFASRMGISKPTAVTQLKELVEAGTLERQGKGPKTRYVFLSTKPSGTPRYTHFRVTDAKMGR
jgi:tetratricopeptide (TPR) repeat protein